MFGQFLYMHDCAFSIIVNGRLTPFDDKLQCRFVERLALKPVSVSLRFFYKRKNNATAPRSRTIYDIECQIVYSHRSVSIARTMNPTDHHLNFLLTRLFFTHTPFFTSWVRSKNVYSSNNWVTFIDPRFFVSKNYLKTLKEN